MTWCHGIHIILARVPDKIDWTTEYAIIKKRLKCVRWHQVFPEQPRRQYHITTEWYPFCWTMNDVIAVSMMKTCDTHYRSKTDNNVPGEGAKNSSCYTIHIIKRKKMPPFHLYSFVYTTICVPYGHTVSVEAIHCNQLDIYIYHCSEIFLLLYFSAILHVRVTVHTCACVYTQYMCIGIHCACMYSLLRNCLMCFNQTQSHFVEISFRWFSFQQTRK